MLGGQGSLEVYGATAEAAQAAGIYGTQSVTGPGLAVEKPQGQWLLLSRYSGDGEGSSARCSRRAMGQAGSRPSVAVLL